MRLLPSKGEKIVFLFAEEERDFFLLMFDFYPLLNPDYHVLSKKPDGKTEPAQSLLREAMEEQRNENRKKLTSFLDSLIWKGDAEKGFELRLTRSQMDWLLEILNNVRMGAWDLLGRPDPAQARKINVATPNARYLGVMELSGLFQSAFLNALENSQPKPHSDTDSAP